MNIAQVGIPSRDIARSLEFYRDKMGIRLVLEAPNMAFFECGGSRLMIGPAEDREPSTGFTLYFSVDEIHAAAEALAARGVIFDRGPHLVARMPKHDLWLALFRDPDENQLALMCEVRP